MPATTDTAPPNQYKQAVDAVRANLKWVLTTLGTIAGALIVGLQLTSLGSLHGLRAWGAIACALAGMLALGTVIMFAAFALSPVGGSYRDFEGAPDFEKLRERVPWSSRTGPPAPELRNQARDLKGLIQRLDTAADATERADILNVLGSLTDLGILLRVEQLFRRTMIATCFAVPVIAASAVGYAYLAHAPDKVDCVAYYERLHALAKDAPRLATTIQQDLHGHRLPIRVDAQARACGIHGADGLARMLSALS